LLVLLVLDLAARTRPQRAGTVDGFPLRLSRLVLLLAVVLFRQLDGQGNVIGILLDDIAQAPAVGELFLATFQVQDDARATLGLFDGRNLEIPFPLARPVHTLAGRTAGTPAVHIDLLGNNKRRIEAHAELAD